MQGLPEGYADRVSPGLLQEDRMKRDYEFIKFSVAKALEMTSNLKKAIEEAAGPIPLPQVQVDLRQIEKYLENAAQGLDGPEVRHDQG